MPPRVHFTTADLLRVTIAERPDPLTDVMTSLCHMQRRDPGTEHLEWQAWARPRIARPLGVLRSFVHPIGYPDFLTPLGCDDLDAGLDAIRYTPTPRMHAELEDFSADLPAPYRDQALAVAQGSPAAFDALSDAVRAYHRAVLAPMEDHVRRRTEEAAARTVRTLVTEGLDAVLAGLHPGLRWEAPVLVLDCKDRDFDVRLDGRGLHLQPCYFTHEPMLGLCCDGPAHLVYPVRHDVVWDPRSLPDGDGDGGGNFDRNGDDGPRGGAGPPSPGRRRALVLRIRAFIQQRLHDPELSPAAVASAHHISVSHLHRLFQEQGTTVAAWIRQQRLEAASQDLADPRLFEQPVRHIATRWGFTHPAAFSRTFRNHYGVPPTDYRWRAERGAL